MKLFKGNIISHGGKVWDFGLTITRNFDSYMLKLSLFTIVIIWCSDNAIKFKDVTDDRT